MSSINKVKLVLLSGFALCLMIWGISGSFSQLGVTTKAENMEIPNVNPDDYVGSETCKACHEDQFKSFSDTKSFNTLDQYQMLYYSPILLMM